MVELGGFEPATNSIPERVSAIPCEIGVNWSKLVADKMRTRVQSRWELGGPGWPQPDADTCGIRVSRTQVHAAETWRNNIPTGQTIGRVVVRSRLSGSRWSLVHQLDIGLTRQLVWKFGEASTRPHRRFVRNRVKPGRSDQFCQNMAREGQAELCRLHPPVVHQHPVVKALAALNHGDWPTRTPCSTPPHPFRSSMSSSPNWSARSSSSWACPWTPTDLRHDPEISAISPTQPAESKSDRWTGRRQLP